MSQENVEVVRRYYEAFAQGAVVFTIREGKIARCREYGSRAEALAAVGLSG